MVVAPTTAVPMSTGFAVALNVFPAPSLSSRNSLASSNFGVNPKFFLISSWIPGICSIVDSSYTDCALSVTGPYESTAIVTGPIPRNPNATSPNANTAGASIRLPRPVVLRPKAMAISAIITIPNQNALKLPATKPYRLFSEGSPSRDDVTISRTCREPVEVNTFTNSGIIAPASVPHVITSDSFHHNVGSPPMAGIRSRDATNVSATETSEVSQTLLF